MPGCPWRNPDAVAPHRPWPHSTRPVRGCYTKRPKEEPAILKKHYELTLGAIKSSARYPASRVEDFDLDGEEDVRLFNPGVSLFISPRHGGAIFEMDVRARDINLLATMARYREAYHEDLPGAAVKDATDVETIHGAPKAAQEGLAAHLRYDAYHRGALIDHFYAPDASLAAIESHEAERGDFTTRRYDFRLSRKSGRLAATMEAEGTACGVRVKLVKEVRVDREEPGFQVEYVLENLGAAPLSTRFGIEFNVALLSPTEPGAFFHRGDQASLGDLRTRDARDVEREWWIRDNPSTRPSASLRAG